MSNDNNEKVPDTWLDFILGPLGGIIGLIIGIIVQTLTKG